MKLPNWQRGIVSKKKVTKYLLSFKHRDGRSKAAFFASYGFSAESWQDLALALRNHAAANEVSKTERSPYGTRFVVQGGLETPSGKSPRVCVVWFLESGEEAPRLITAYPMKRKSV